MTRQEVLMLSQVASLDRIAVLRSSNIVAVELIQPLWRFHQMLRRIRTEKGLEETEHLDLDAGELLEYS